MPNSRSHPALLQYLARMSLLPFDALPAHKPRRFVPQAIDLGDWDQIAPLFDQLEARAAACATAADLERWLLDWSELNAALDEESSKRYIAMTCHTDNAEAEKAYLHFVEHVEPAAQAAPVQARPDLRRASAPRAIAQRALPGVRPRHAGPGRAVPRGERAAGNRGGQAWPAVSEAERLADRAVPRRGEDADPDGPLPRGDRPRRCARKPGSWSPTGGCRKPRSSRKSSTSSSSCASRSPGTPASPTTAIMPSASWAGSITRRPIARRSTRPSSRRSCPCCASCRPSASASSAWSRCGPGIWRWTR